MLSIGALSAIILVGCGNGDNNVSTKNKSTDTAPENVEEQKEQPKEEPKVGTRSNPIKINQIASINTVVYDDSSTEYQTNIELTVIEVIRGEEAQQRLKEMNEYNQDAPEGYEWILVKSKVKVADSETEDYPLTIDGIMNFKFVSKSGDIYSGDVTGSTEPDFSFEMYKGNEKEGFIAGLIKSGEEATMEYDSWAGERVFFELK